MLVSTHHDTEVRLMCYLWFFSLSSDPSICWDHFCMKRRGLQVAVPGNDLTAPMVFWISCGESGISCFTHLPSSLLSRWRPLACPCPTWRRRATAPWNSGLGLVKRALSSVAGHSTFWEHQCGKRKASFGPSEVSTG